MQAFDPRAVFVEEGSKVMADTYRHRRTLAVRFFCWSAAVFAARSQIDGTNYPTPGTD
jgi:hypothetical protein